MPQSHKDVLDLLFPVPLAGVFDGDTQVDADALDNAKSSGDNLFQEIFPDTSNLLLSSWERICGLAPMLPTIVFDADQVEGDDLEGGGGTFTSTPAPISARQARVILKLRARGGLSMQYFIGLAADLGYTITITGGKPFMCGIGRCGDPLSSWFVWTVSAPYAAKESIEDLFNQLKPAWTVIVFKYS